MDILKWNNRQCLIAEHPRADLNAFTHINFINVTFNTSKKVVFRVHLSWLFWIRILILSRLDSWIHVSSCVADPESLNPEYLNNNPKPESDPDLDPGFWWPKIKNTAGKKIFIFLIKNCYLLIPRAPERTQATGEAFNPQKRTSSTSKYEIS